MPDNITMTGAYAYASDPYTPVRILCVDRPGEWPVVSMDDNGRIWAHSLSGWSANITARDIIPLKTRRKPVGRWLVAIPNGRGGLIHSAYDDKQAAFEWMCKHPGAMMTHLVEVEGGE